LAQAARRIRTLPARPTIEVLAPRDLERIHDASVEVLERVGLWLRSERVLRRLGDETDAKVDLVKGRARFPSRMIEAALAAAPRSYLMAARDRAADVVLDRTHGYLSYDGCAAEIVDLATGQRRPPTYRDLVDATRLADATPEVSYLWPCVAISDVPPSDQALHQTYIQLSNSSKHYTAMSTYEKRDALAVIEMGIAVAGSAQALKERPILSTFQCSISPLTYDGGPIEAALAFAEAGLPCGFVAMAVATAGAPTTLAGHLVSVNAELLGGITILESLHPGTPTFYGPYQAFMDMMSGSLQLDWGPEDVLFKLAAAQLARRYDLPMNIMAFATGAKTQDWQAGAQHALSLMGVLAAGNADLVSATGTLYGSRVFAFENVLLDAELWDLAATMLAGIPVTDDDLALPVIEDVGPGNHFLDQDHTLAHMRERWSGRFFAKDTWEEWEAVGRPEPKHRARDRALELIASHQPLPLDETVDRELRAIVARYAAAAATTDTT
jgi:trimethylamine---corrinoid protein Co-methyltransferase